MLGEREPKHWSLNVMDMSAGKHEVHSKDMCKPGTDSLSAARL